MCFIIRSRRAEEKVIHAVIVKGNHELVGNFYLLKKVVVFPNRGMKLILISRSLRSVLPSAGFCLLR